MEPLLVLVVDDDVSWCHSVAEALREAGYRVEMAHTGAEAIGLTEREAPAALVLDVQLPDMSGLDVLQQLRQSGHLVPTVVVSAIDTASIMDQAMQAGARAILRKPTSLEFLLAALVRLTEGNKPACPG